MYYVNLKQQKILQNINKFGCMTYKQIRKINNFSDLDKQLKSLVRQSKIRILDDNIYVTRGVREVNKNVLSAIDLYIYLNFVDKESSIAWCVIEDFPFIMAFFRNNKVFDIAVIKEGEETICSVAINRSAAERVIVILKDSGQLEKVRISKPVKYCTVNDGTVIFLENGDD